MIVDVLFFAVKAVLTPIFALLPTFSLIDTLDIPDVGATLGAFAQPFHSVIPIGPIATMLAGVFAIFLPCYAAYKFANWVWRHIPDLWGFGPGAG